MGQDRVSPVLSLIGNLCPFSYRCETQYENRCEFSYNNRCSKTDVMSYHNLCNGTARVFLPHVTLALWGGKKAQNSLVGEMQG